MPTSETARLLGAAIDRDAAARSALMERLRPRIVLWASTRLSEELRAKVEPDDVAQLVLISIHSGFDRFAGREPGQLFAWVFSIAENRVRDLARHFGAAKRAPTDGESIEDELVRARAEARVFSRTSPSQAVARAEEIERMRRALDALPERQRTMIRLRDLEMREYEDIVSLMQLDSTAAARSLRCRALVALGDAMKSNNGAGR